MPTKTAAQNSLYIVLFSQVSSVLQTILSRTVPQFDLVLFIGMVVCGILGGVIGRKIYKKIDDSAINRLFIILMAVIMLINVYDIYHYLW